MRLLDRCTTIRSQIAKRNDLRRAHKDAESLRARVSEFQILREDVAAAVARLVVLKKKGVPLVKLPSPATAKAVLIECQAKLAENPTDIGRDYSRLRRSIEKLAKELLGVTEKAIESVRRDLPSVEEAFLKHVELIPGYANQVASIRRQRDALLNGNDPHASAEALGQFLDRRDALRKLADDLKPDEFPREVLEFFRAGRHGGAPLDRLTDTVRQWLADRDLIKNVRVTVVAR